MLVKAWNEVINNMIKGSPPPPHHLMSQIKELVSRSLALAFNLTCSVSGDVGTSKLEAERLCSAGGPADLHSTLERNRELTLY